jgi:hypothetical protein
MAEVRPLERAYTTAVAEMERVDEADRDIAWLLEEWRISVFAQPVGVVGTASPKRIRREWERATGGRLVVD